ITQADDGNLYFFHRCFIPQHRTNRKPVQTVDYMSFLLFKTWHICGKQHPSAQARSDQTETAQCPDVVTRKNESYPGANAPSSATGGLADPRQIDLNKSI